jgi:putative ABC transport system permease protein
MTRILNDLRFGLRMLAKTPSATAMVLVALSLGIGLSAMMFSLIDGAVLTELPGDHGNRITRVSRADLTAQTRDDLAAWTARQRSFEMLGAYDMNMVTLTIDGSAGEPVRGAAITPSILPMMATQPTIGRAFTAEDARSGAPAVILLSHELWQERFDANPTALGRVVRVNGKPAEVIGVLPAGFGFPWDQQVWSPLDVDPARPGDVFTPTLESRGVVGRLRDGVTLGAAERELTAITAELDRGKRGKSGTASTVIVRGYTDLFSEAGQSATLSALMLGIALLVLLVACSNVANVLLARAVARRKEIAVRLALGASRTRITMQLLVETTVLAAAGALGGVAITMFGTQRIEAAMPPGMPYWMSVRVDWAVLAFIAGVAVLAALMAGLMPALQAARANTHDALKEDARGSSSFRLGRVMRRLVGVEIALSFVLLVLAGLFIKSASNFRATDFAFQPEDVYTAQLRLPDGATDAPARIQLADRVREAVSGLPQVGGVALSTAVPGVGSSQAVPVEIDGSADRDAANRARSIVVSPGFFDLFRTPVATGRDFDVRDRTGGLPVAIVNESFAKRYFPAGALERRVRLSTPTEPGEWLTIVGVTRDLMEGGVDGDDPEAVYLPLAQNARTELTVVARPRGSFAAVPTPIREALTALDPDMALYRVQRHGAVIDDANSGFVWFSIMFLVSGGIALFLAALGLYGVMAFWVIQRTREIGVRMALGGQRRDIVRLVLRQGLAQTSVGLIAGVVLAVPAAAVLSSAMFGVAPYDPVVFGTVFGVMIGAAWLGCWMPARRATRVDPLRALTE